MSNFEIFNEINKVLDERKISNNESSYVKKMLDGGVEKIAQKVGEEASELIIEAMKNDPQGMIYESADLLFHLLLLLKKQEITFNAVLDELDRRRKS